MRGPVRVTRRGLQLGLAVLWLLDAALQFQPYMFSRSFARDVIAASADGQPVVVAGPVHLLGDVVAAHPVLTNAAFACIQLALAIGLFWRRSARTALFASIAWSLGVWWLGEGLGGLLSGHAMLLTGAPGAVLFYAVVAAAAVGHNGGDGRGEPPAAWTTLVWAGVWGLGALLQLLPGQSSSSSVADAVADSVSGGPSWLVSIGSHVAAGIADRGWVLAALVAAQLAIAVTGAFGGRLRLASVVGGGLLAVGFWVFGQGLGELSTGTSTDPNSAPLLVLLAFTVSSAVASHRAPVLALPRQRQSAGLRDVGLVDLAQEVAH